MPAKEGQVGTFKYEGNKETFVPLEDEPAEEPKPE